MGTEIAKKIFTQEDQDIFQQNLRRETKLLMNWFKRDYFEKIRHHVTGMELEACLVDTNMVPAPENKRFLYELNNSKIVPEISQFNFEINSDPQICGKDVIERTEAELSELWKLSCAQAEKMGLKAINIGILPTIRDNMLKMENISEMHRFFAINQRIMQIRKGQPMHINIQGKDELILEQQDFMMESAATSLQIHLQVNQEQAVRFYNASLILSAAMVALSANSPFLYGKELWDESRIPVFEQAVNVGSFRDKTGRLNGRVTFGSGYLRESFFELFLENLDGYPALLPMNCGGEENSLNHLRLHNGNIWRWNRPIIGINPNGRPHLRIEHRVCPAGPTIKDMLANIAFYLGGCYQLANDKKAPEKLMDFETTRSNFYAAAKYGLEATVQWTDGKTWNIRELILKVLIPQIKEGCQNLGMSESTIKNNIDDIIYPRVESKQNGANWQKKFVQKYGKRFQELTQEYLKRQEAGSPVHLWDL